MDNLKSNAKICFIGAGSIAEALFSGMLKNNVVSSNQIYLTNNQNLSRLEYLHSLYSVNIPTTVSEKYRFIKNADIIVLAFKPKMAKDVLTSLNSLLERNTLIISLVTGLSIPSIESVLGDSMPIVRVMPNTPIAIGLGVSAVCFSRNVISQYKDLTIDIFKSVGEVYEIEEDNFDLITALSGSGPAYVYYVMEAMIETALHKGLDKTHATRLISQTFLGAANMVKLTGEEPSILRKHVTSPNGTTQAAIEIFEQNNIKDGIISGIKSAITKSEDLGHSIKIDVDSKESSLSNLAEK